MLFAYLSVIVNAHARKMHIIKYIKISPINSYFLYFCSVLYYTPHPAYITLHSAIKLTNFQSNSGTLFCTILVIYHILHIDLSTITD